MPILTIRSNCFQASEGHRGPRDVPGGTLARILPPVWPAADVAGVQQPELSPRRQSARTRNVAATRVQGETVPIPVHHQQTDPGTASQTVQESVMKYTLRNRTISFFLIFTHLVFSEHEDQTAEEG